MKLSFFHFIILLILGNVYGNAQTTQRFAVESFALDQSTTTSERSDSDGYPMALIRVTSNDTESLGEYAFNFGNQYSIKDSRNHADELWLFVQRNAKRVKITRGNTVVEYDLKPMVEAGKVYDMYIKGPERVMRLQMVRFDVSPAEKGAMVFVKGSDSDAAEAFFGTTGAEGSVAKNLRCGQYSYRVMAEYYKEANGTFVLDGNSNDTHTERVTLLPNFAEATFTVDADADIYINNENKGRRRWSGRLEPGDYQVECRQESHTASTKIVSLKAGDKPTIALDKPSPILGRLSIISSPLDAAITIDGKEYGLTPRNIDIVIGRHSVTVAKSGYQSFTQTVDVKKDMTQEITAELKEKAAEPRIATIAAEPEKPKQSKGGEINGHEYVDLGLPSGLLWATCNVGASKPEEYGNYFAWGETSTKNDYPTFISTTYGKTIDQLKAAGIIGNDGYLTASFDAATKAWGGTWRMPTFDEIKELKNNTTSTWTRQNGVYGRKVTSKTNSNYIFLPAAGFRTGTTLNKTGLDGNYWSSSPNVRFSNSAYFLYFNSFYDYKYDSVNSSLGFTVRPVSEP